MSDRTGACPQCRGCCQFGTRGKVKAGNCHCSPPNTERGLSSAHEATALGGLQTGLGIVFPTKGTWVSEQGTKGGTCQCQPPQWHRLRGNLVPALLGTLHALALGSPGSAPAHHPHTLPRCPEPQQLHPGAWLGFPRHQQ